MVTNKSLLNGNRISISQKSINILMCIVFVIPLLVILGDLATSIVSGIIVSCMFLLPERQFYNVFPILILFYSLLVIQDNIVVYRVYTLIFFFRLIIHQRKFKRYNLMFLLIPLLLYPIIIIAPSNFRLGVSLILDLLFLIFYLGVVLNTPENTRSFFKYFTFAVFITCIYSLIVASSQLSTGFLVDGSWINVTRTIGVFPDPNYFGFFINIAIFSNLILPVFNSRVLKYASIALLYITLISTLSMTGIICNVLCLLAFVLLTYKMNLKTIAKLLGIFGLVAILIYIMADVPTVKNLLVRLNSIIQFSRNDNTTDILSGRLTIWERHWNTFINQNIIKILFGGNKILPLIIDRTQFSSVSHQEYLDQILSVGLVGFITLGTYFGFSLKTRIKRFKTTKESTELLIIFSKTIWLIYGFMLTMLYDPKFMIFFLI